MMHATITIAHADVNDYIVDMGEYTRILSEKISAIADDEFTWEIVEGNNPRVSIDVGPVDADHDDDLVEFMLTSASYNIMQCVVETDEDEGIWKLEREMRVVFYCEGEMPENVDDDVLLMSETGIYEDISSDWVCDHLDDEICDDCEALIDERVEEYKSAIQAITVFQTSEGAETGCDEYEIRYTIGGKARVDHATSFDIKEKLMEMVQ